MIIIILMLRVAQSIVSQTIQKIKNKGCLSPYDSDLAPVQKNLIVEITAINFNT